MHNIKQLLSFNNLIHLLRADYFIFNLPDTGSRFSLDMSFVEYCSCHLSDHMATHFGIITT